jgi:hypothetical protein
LNKIENLHKSVCCLASVSILSRIFRITLRYWLGRHHIVHQVRCLFDRNPVYRLLGSGYISRIFKIMQLGSGALLIFNLVLPCKRKNTLR